MFYNSFNNNEYNDCVLKGACSISPNLSSMQEVMYILLRQIAYYLIKLENSNVTMQDVMKEVITEIAIIDALKDFSETQILALFSKQYSNLVKCRKEYLKVCKETNIQPVDLKNIIKLSSQTNLSSLLKRGDKEFLQKYKKFSFEKKYFAEILLSVIRSVSINLVTLFELGQFPSSSVYDVLKALDLFNRAKLAPEQLKYYANILAKRDVVLLSLINKSQVQNYGELSKNQVSFSTRINKAIMVSGSNLADLKAVLEAVDGKNIDVYTNGNLIIAHAFPYFKNSKNLIGHFGSGTFTTILDFATFPGAILLTKNEAQNIEYLYRGRLFTTDDITPKGVVKILDNNFTPLLDSALQAKGFAKGQNRKSLTIGYDESEFEKYIDKMVSSNPRMIFIVGHSELSMSETEYYKKFFDIMPENTYAISFSYNPNLENVFTINLANDYALIYKALSQIFTKIPINSEKLSFFITKCDVNSLSNIINLKNNGAKNIFLSDCPSLVINPAVLKTFLKVFDVHNITDPEKDISLLFSNQ